MSIQVFEGDGVEPRSVIVVGYHIFEERADGSRNYVVAHSNSHATVGIDFQANFPHLPPMHFTYLETLDIRQRFSRDNRPPLEIVRVEEQRWLS